MINIITREKYDALTAGYDCELWRRNAAERWEYHACAAYIVRQIAALTPDLRVLEIGCHGVQIVEGSTTMDVINAVWPAPVAPDITHDIQKIPWPCGDNEYDVLIALRVWQHLGPDQMSVLREASRIAQHLIIAAPFVYPNGDGIVEEIMSAWGRELGLTHQGALLAHATGTIVHWLAR